MKKWIGVLRNFVKVAVFLGIVGTILCGANFVLKLKSIDGNYVAQMFYEQAQDTVDVVFIGSSHVYTNVNPAVLWSEYGMASYDLAGSNQPLWNSYYYMKEAIELQTPDLVVVDLYRAIENRDVIDDARTAMNTLGMKPGANRTASIYASVENEASATDYIWGVPVYHTRYESLTENDFKRYNGDVNGLNYKGFNMNCISTTVFEGLSDFTEMKDRLPLTQKNEEYLRKIIELARETDTPLLLMVAPYQGIMPSDKMIFNEAQALAKEYDVPYVDFNEHYQEIGFDPREDFAESSHLNYYGSEKFSTYLGKYLKNRYDIPDRRGDETYISWEENAKYYEKIAYNFRLRNTPDMEEYLRLLLDNEDYTVCISLDGGDAIGGIEAANVLGKYGVEAGGEAVIVLEGGQPIFYADDSFQDGYEFYKDIGNKTLGIQGTPAKKRDTVTGETTEYVEKTIELSKTGCLIVGYGMNILLYDNYTQTYLDSFGFNALDGYQKVRY